MQAQITLRETTEKLNALSAERQRKVVEELTRETQAAERTITEAKNLALASLRDIAIEATREAAQKLTGVALDAGRAGGAVDAALRERG